MNLRHLGFAVLLVMAATPLYAAWEDCEGLPPWLQRGAADFGTGMGEPFDQRLLEEDFGLWGPMLLWSQDSMYSPPRYPQPELLERYFDAVGLRQAFYICSKTMYGDNRNADRRGLGDWWGSNVFEKYPYAASRAALDPEGERQTAYAGLWTRNVASRNASAWIDHLGQIMRWMAYGLQAVTNEHLRPQLHELPTAGFCEAFYIDNPSLVVSYDPKSLADFEAYAREQLGRHEDPRTTDDPAMRIAWLNFNHQVHAEHFRALKDRANALDPPRYIWTNYADGAERELADAESIDAVYAENTLDMPPRHWNLYAYKRLLALQHGRPVGIGYYKAPWWIKLDADDELLARLDERNQLPYYESPRPRTRAWAELAEAGVVGDHVAGGDIEGHLTVSSPEGLQPDTLAGRSHQFAFRPGEEALPRDGLGAG